MFRGPRVYQQELMNPLADGIFAKTGLACCDAILHQEANSARAATNAHGRGVLSCKCFRIKCLSVFVRLGKCHRFGCPR